MTRSGVRLPSAPPNSSNTLETQAKSKQCEPDVANCDHRLVHKQSSTNPKSPSPSKDLAGSDWRRSVVHIPHDKSRTHAAGSSASPPSRSSRNVPGLIVRGRVFYLRLRVPRTLQEKVGRTHSVKLMVTNSGHRSFDFYWGLSHETSGISDCRDTCCRNGGHEWVCLTSDESRSSTS